MTGFAAFGADPPGALPPDPRGIFGQRKTGRGLA